MKKLIMKILAWLNKPFKWLNKFDPYKYGPQTEEEWENHQW